MVKNYALFIFFLLICLSCNLSNNQKAIDIKVFNPSETDYIDALVTIDINSLPIDLKSIQDYVLTKDSIYPFQLLDDNEDGKFDKLVFVCDLKSGQEESFKIVRKNKNDKLDFKKRSYAEISVKENGVWEIITKKDGNTQYEYKGGTFNNVKYLRVPDEHTDHSNYIRYEGAGWESDKVGYRFYLDWRNATDIFGKKVDTIVLHNVGQDGFESYHEQGDWGMDILKVGSSLGIGSIATWIDNKAVRVEKTDSIISEIVENGVIQSSIKTNYYGWETEGAKIDLTAILSIHAGSRLTKTELILSDKINNICTGIVKLENTETITPNDNTGTWTYFATYGKQSLADDSLGMVVFYKSADLTQITEDEYSHVIVLKPSENKIQYYFAAVWEQEPNGIKSKSEFIEYLNNKITYLNTGLKVTF